MLDVAGTGDLVDVEYLPAHLHNTPGEIVPALAPRVDRAVEEGRAVFVAYSDCGTGGGLDTFFLSHPAVQRLPGAHCYEMFAGADRFERLSAEAPGTFYLTDFLARHFEALVWRGLGLDRAPQLREVYFGNYTRVVYLAQTDDPRITALAEHAAERLGLAFDRRFVGRGGLDPILTMVPEGATR